MDSNPIAALQGFSVSQPAVPSPDGALIAAVDQSHLVLRTSSDGQIVETFSLPRNDGGLYPHIKWSHSQKSPATDKPLRILLANDVTIRVFDVKSTLWSAVVNGPAGNVGKIAHTDFGVDEAEVVVFSDFGAKVTIWSLVTSRGVEIRDPKAGSRCHDYRPKSKHWAILTRELAHDNLLILAPKTRDVLENVELPTVDAQGVNWSPDGRWLVIWDTLSAGYRVLIYTADGHLFKTYAGGQTVDDVGLGVKNVKWSPRGGDLAIGDCDDRVTVLANSTFHPKFHYIHSNSVEPHQTEVWEEQIQRSRSRDYKRASQLSSLPSQASLLGKGQSDTGISLMEFNTHGTLLATRSDSTPSTLWIWSMTSPIPIAVLIHHAAIRSVHWHPTVSDLLLIHCALKNPIVYLWKSTWETPKILKLHLDNSGGRMEACWLFSDTHEQPSFMIGNASNYTVAQLDLNGHLLPSQDLQQAIDRGVDDRFDGSLVELSPLKSPHSNPSFGSEEDLHGQPGQWGMTDDLDDTFQYRRQTKLTV